LSEKSYILDTFERVDPITYSQETWATTVLPTIQHQEYEIMCTDTIDYVNLKIRFCGFLEGSKELVLIEEITLIKSF